MPPTCHIHSLFVKEMVKDVLLFCRILLSVSLEFINTCKCSQFVRLEIISQLRATNVGLFLRIPLSTFFIVMLLLHPLNSTWNVQNLWSTKGQECLFTSSDTFGLFFYYAMYLPLNLYQVCS